MARGNPGSNRIFVSYSHLGRGSDWKAKAIQAPHVLERHHLLDMWEDGKIRVSSYWDGDIKQAMGSARLAVVLLTKGALESEYIMDTGRGQRMTAKHHGPFAY
jgi:hypothetical protein